MPPSPDDDEGGRSPLCKPDDAVEEKDGAVRFPARNRSSVSRAPAKSTLFVIGSDANRRESLCSCDHDDGVNDVDTRPPDRAVAAAAGAPFPHGSVRFGDGATPRPRRTRSRMHSATSEAVARSPLVRNVTVSVAVLSMIRSSRAVESTMSTMSISQTVSRVVLSTSTTRWWPQCTATRCGCGLFCTTHENPLSSPKMSDALFSGDARVATPLSPPAMRMGLASTVNAEWFPLAVDVVVVVHAMASHAGGGSYRSRRYSDILWGLEALHGTRKLVTPGKCPRDSPVDHEPQSSRQTYAA